MNPQLKNMIRVGIVSSIDPTTCTARVAFEDQDNTVSPELPILVRGTLGAKDYWMPIPGEQVWCLFLPTGNAEGIILGSSYSEQDKPPVTDANKRHITFFDGSEIEYDASAHKLTVNTSGAVEITAAQNVIINANLTVQGNISAVGLTASGNMNVNGGISVTGNISTSSNVTAVGDVTAGSISLKTHVHKDDVSPGDENTSPPI